MGYHSLVPLAAAAANLVICLVVLSGGMRRPGPRTFAWLTLCVVAWNLDIFALYHFEDPARAEWWSRVFRTGICMAPAAMVHATLVLADCLRGRWVRVLAGAYVMGAVLAVANLLGLLVRGVGRHAWGWYIEPTPLYSALTALLLLGAGLWVERVLHAYRHPVSPRQREQAKLWLLAAVVQVPFLLTNLLPLYGVKTYPLGNVGNVFTTGILAYAIARHRLMDVDYVVRKGVGFFLASALVLAPGAFGLLELGEALGSEVPLVFACAALALALVAVMLIPKLQEVLETRLHRAVFPRFYDYRRRLRELSEALVHVLDQAELLRRLGEALGEILDVERCEVFVQDEQTHRLVLVYPAERRDETLPGELTGALERLPGPTLATELEAEENPAAALFAWRGWEVGLPLRVHDRLTGFVGLGRNREFRIFSAEDLRLLANVASGASVALENATLSRQLRRSEVVLERANRLSSLGALAAGIAHEIRNPLVAVKTFLDLLPERLDDQQFVSQFRDLGLSELRRVNDLISNLLSLGKSTTRHRGPVAVGEALEPVVKLMASTARKRQVEVVSTLQPNLPQVWADSDQLKQIVLNLLLNAIEVSPPGTTVRISVRLGEEPPPRVVVEVGDEGPGIPADHLEDIFHPFFTTKETGVGLGLALVHQMVVEHGGEITVESEVGRGACFRVVLPVEDVALRRTGT
jgi:signal transduction histidine kinase